MVKSFIKRVILDQLRSDPGIRYYVRDMVNNYMAVDLKPTIDYLGSQQQELKGQVEEDLKNTREYFASEEFLDSVIDRIKRKQL